MEKSKTCVFLSLLLCLFCIAPTQCWCGTHRYLHSHWPSDFPDWKGQSCRRVWHRPWSAHAPAPYGADRGRTPSHTVHYGFGPSCVVWKWEYWGSLDLFLCLISLQDQYVFLNQCAMDIIRSRTGTNVDLIYQNTAALSIYENLEPKKGYYKNGYHNS